MTRHKLNAPAVLPFTRLDWAFAGTSSSSIRPDPTDKGKQIVHSQWRHWVDSRSANAEEIVDEGAMFPQLDGTTLESGAMVNPATGRLSEYEECWRDVEAVATEATGTADGEGKAMCAVLVLQDDVNGARGVVVRVGQFVQGILRVGESVSLERWAWRRDGGWIREVKMGDMWLPCGAIMDGQRMRLGGEVRYGDFVWKVVELGEV